MSNPSGRVLAAVLLTAVSLVTMTADVSAAGISFESVAGKWTEAGQVPTLAGLGSSSIRWGRPATAQGQSSYDFDAAAPFSADVGSQFSLGQFTHRNNAVYGPSNTLARLAINYSFRLGDDPDRLLTRDFDVDFTHLETRNRSATCADGGANGVGVNAWGCADRVTLALFEAIIDTFKIGDTLYTLTLSGFDTGGIFWTEEGRINVSNLMGSLTAVLDDSSGGGNPPPVPPPVPLPAAGLLLLVALGGLGVATRRRNLA